MIKNFLILYPLVLTFSLREKGLLVFIAAMQIHITRAGKAGISLVVHDFTAIPTNVHGTAMYINDYLLCDPDARQP
jgi:hypothetical protein